MGKPGRESTMSNVERSTLQFLGNLISVERGCGVGETAHDILAAEPIMSAIKELGFDKDGIFVNRPLSRRAFLRLGLLSGAGLALAACGLEPPAPPALTPTPNKTATPRAALEILVADVLNYDLTSAAWPGGFGEVTFRIHEALYDGEAVYYFCTDTSNETYAQAHKLVLAPLLIGARGELIANRMYLFPGGQPPVVRSIPGQSDYLSLFELVYVTLHDESLRLSYAAEIEAAAAAGGVSLEPSEIFVNCPLVQWPGGALEVDQERDSYLGTGQLLAPVDTVGKTVRFKLHEGYPGDRYITVDTSAVDRAQMMHLAPSAASWSLTKHNAVDEVFVFANGIPGPGVMGYQPAVFGSEVDSLVWSPFWNHFTIEWVHEDLARVLQNADEVYDAIERGELIKYNGVPDLHPNGFVVNCPIPILANNTFKG